MNPVAGRHDIKKHKCTLMTSLRPSQILWKWFVIQPEIGSVIAPELSQIKYHNLREANYCPFFFLLC